MAIDNTQFNYASDWEIDQLVTSGTATVAIPTASYPATYVPLTSLTTQSGGMPVVDGTWSADGGTTWRQFGDPFNGGGIYLDVTTTQLQVKCAYTTAATIQVRYYIYTDKVDY